MKEILEWLVIGAGPAGISTVGKLLDHQISNNQIGWLDPAFQVGDLGAKWQSVPSNTKVHLFLKFLNGCEAFRYKEFKELFSITQIPGENTCLLKEVVEPLEWITSHLRSTVRSIQDTAVRLKFERGLWNVKMSSSSIKAKNVVLCTGADPKKISHPNIYSIPLEVALNPDRLSKEIKPGDQIAVFGSSHSAVLALHNLTKLKPKMIYNFFRSPHRYAIESKHGLLFGDSGLRGVAAEWAKQHLDQVIPLNLKRYLLTSKNYKKALSCCNKAIYAIGFQERRLAIEPFPNAKHHETTGIIAPHLFGLGIAYPLSYFTPFGHREYRVGLASFMEHLNVMMPTWIQYASN